MTRRRAASADRTLRVDRAWHANFETTDPLAVRLATLGRFYRPTGPFGLEVLGRGDLDGKRVLEIGPGNGAHAVRVLDRTGARPADWTLLDRSEAMVREARAAIAARAPSRGVVGDADVLPLAEDARFDVVIAMHVLIFVASPGRVLDALAARLARGGRLLVTAPGDRDSAAVRRMIRASVRRRGLPWRNVARYLHSAGAAERDLRRRFRRVDVHPQQGALAFPDADSAVRYFASMAWLVGMPDAVRREIDDEVRAMADRAIRRGGVFRVPKGAGTFVASRPILLGRN